MVANPNMPLKTLSLKKKKEFERVFLYGRKFFFKQFLVKAISNNLGVVRIGVVVSKKISKLAVVRNKIRRRIRNAFILANKNNSIDVVFYVSPKITEVDYNEIKKAVKYACKNIQKSRLCVSGGNNKTD